MAYAPCGNRSVTCADSVMIQTIDDLIFEAHDASGRFWFVQGFNTVEQTNATVTLHLTIGPSLFVQAFFSQNSRRLNLALISQGGSLYGRDYEHGTWHRHPFGQSEQHEPTPEGMSAQPLTQFMTEVEEILIEHGLI